MRKHSRVRVPPSPPMTFWKLPPKIKIYEALGCLDNTAKIFSSSRGKYYTVTFDPTTNAVMCNDNGSYWQGYLGYPAIAFLLARGVIPYSASSADILKEIKWKNINQQFKNDFTKTENYCHDLVKKRGGDLPTLLADIDSIYSFLSSHPYSLFGPKTKPPSGY
ncbi:MAG: hypothetical protein UX64_C0046G0009 [Microgenomates group bacterium GW2011_GWC2_46_7]|nr:MAG: hypothetical protein UX64_C0046G0009 [Microgenomates group bacterium GW2011_GWC2_46_7]